MKHSFKVTILMLLGLLAYAGCHTVQGAGEDIQRGGEHLSNAAQDANK